MSGWLGNQSVHAADYRLHRAASDELGSLGMLVINGARREEVQPATMSACPLLCRLLWHQTGEIGTAMPSSCLVNYCKCLQGLHISACSAVQAASGAGQAAMDELWHQTGEIVNGKPPTTRIFPYQVPCTGSSCHLCQGPAGGQNQLAQACWLRRMQACV